MSDKQVLVLGTAARGGISSVIMAYEKASFYSPGRARFIASHVEGSILRRLVTASRSYTVVVVMLLRRRVALLHLHMSMRGSFWRKALFLTMGYIAGVPVVVHLHGSEFAMFYEASPRWMQRVVRRVLDRASAVVVLAESWRQFVSTLTRTPVVVIRNFVPDEYDPAQAARARNRHALLFLGQFGARKGIYDLVPCFADVLHSVPDAHLYCGGNGEVEKVRELVRELRLDNAVHVPGWVSGKEKRALLHGCGIFVLPSHNEGLPIAIIEAMSCAMAVVSTRIGGIPELVDDSNGVLIEPGNHNGLRAALSRLLAQDEESLAAMGEASRAKYLRLYSADACLDQMRELYRSLGVMP